MNGAVKRRKIKSYRFSDVSLGSTEFFMVFSISTLLMTLGNSEAKQAGSVRPRSFQRVAVA